MLHQMGQSNLPSLLSATASNEDLAMKTNNTQGKIHCEKLYAKESLGKRYDYLKEGGYYKYILEVFL